MDALFSGQTWQDATCSGEAKAYSWQFALKVAEIESPRWLCRLPRLACPNRRGIANPGLLLRWWPKIWNDTGDLWGNYRRLAINQRFQIRQIVGTGLPPQCHSNLTIRTLVVTCFAHRHYHSSRAAESDGVSAHQNRQTVAPFSRLLAAGAPYHPRWGLAPRSSRATASNHWMSCSGPAGCCPARHDSPKPAGWIRPY